MAKSNSLKYKFNVKSLCTPSFIYLIISLTGLILMGVQNIDGKDSLLCVGDYNCVVGNNTFIFVLEGIYILFWTFILDLMCKNGYKNLSWFLLLLPILLFFVILGIVMILYKKQ